jgi:hypothetical protein
MLKDLTVNNELIMKSKFIVFTLCLSIYFFVGCSGWETVSFREYKKIEQLRGQPPEIYVQSSDSYDYIFSHSNYYIQNDTLFGKDNSGREIVLTNIEFIHYNYDVEQDVEVYYDPEKDSVIGYKYAGAKAYIEMEDGTDYSGELLIVRDSITIVCEEYGADEQKLADSVYSFFVLNNSDIKLIELSVGNYLGIGAGVGYLAGALAGGVAAYSAYSGPDRYAGFNAYLIGSGVGFFGAIIGGTIGFFFTDYDDVYEYEDHTEYDFKKLNIFARYVNNEPEFLQNMK